MKRIIIIIIAVLLYNHVNSQITKGNWLVGGNANFSGNTQEAFGYTDKTSTFQISPDVGYLFIDKLASGLRLDFSFSKYKKNPSNTSLNLKVNHYIFGPFMRYYFLRSDGRANLFAEADYGYGIVRSNNGMTVTTSKFSSYSFLAGPVIYVNNVVGIEFTIGYKFSRELNEPVSNRTLFAGIGLQIHLEKDR